MWHEKLLWSSLLLLILGCNSKKIAATPPPVNTVAALDSLPLSDIDIPISINLRPLYDMAERNVQETYTTPDYPQRFVEDNCDTRYMYKFRRGPLQFSSAGDQLQIGFTGYYIIAGGQRLCSGSGNARTPLSPWSPTCTCGLKEGERRVNVGFTASLTVSPSYRIVPMIRVQDPKPLDKCTVCFWGQDITPLVMDRLKAQLGEARAGMQDSLSKLDLRPQFQKLWDLLNSVQPIYTYGYLQINPEQIRMSNLRVEKDTLKLSFGISARPRLVQQRPAQMRTVIPNLSPAPSRRGFSIHADALLNYDSLSQILQTRMYRKRIDAEGTGKHLIVEKVEVYGSNSSTLNLKMLFSGSASGTFYLSGKPRYDAAAKELRLENLEYDIRSRNLILTTAEWLFNGRIMRELERYARFNLREYEKDLLQGINSQFNREIKPGITLNGAVQGVGIEKIYPFLDRLVLRFSGNGDLEVKVSELVF